VATVPGQQWRLFPCFFPICPALFRTFAHIRLQRPDFGQVRKRRAVLCRGNGIHIAHAEAYTIEIHPRASLTVNNSLLIRSALIDGAGIALIPDFIVRDDISTGAVVPILTEFEWEPFGIFVVRPSDRRLPRRVSLFIDFLAESLHGGPARTNEASGSQERLQGSLRTRPPKYTA
jgi:DNA-binding transcriptional LysR family regulator